MEIFIYVNEQNMLPPPDLAAEIERLQEELLIERERNLRTFAEFKNYRRRAERDGIKLTEKSKHEIMLPMSEITDDMEKSL